MQCPHDVTFSWVTRFVTRVTNHAGVRNRAATHVSRPHKAPHNPRCSRKKLKIPVRLSRSAYLEIRRISSVRHLPTRKATVQLMCSFVLGRLDYCNSLLIDITSYQMYRLQKIQNHAAKVVFRQSKDDHVTPLLKKLHWLPGKERILFKIATFDIVCLMPTYLLSCLSVILSLSRTLRSNSDGKNSFLCKMETQGLWSPVVLCSGAPCLKQSSSPHPTQLLPRTVQNFP